MPQRNTSFLIATRCSVRVVAYNEQRVAKRNYDATCVSQRSLHAAKDMRVANDESVDVVALHDQTLRGSPIGEDGWPSTFNTSR